MKTQINSPIADAAQVFKILGNPQRLAILYQLLDSGQSLQELAAETGQTVTQVAAHLDKMRQLGLVDYTRFMRIMEYRLISPQVKSVLETMKKRD